MAQSVHPSTLFHLIPRDESTCQALNHTDNLRYVSPASNGLRGLEIGFHVSSTPGRVIARLGRGRNADLILRGRQVSSVHVAFEIHTETKVVLLSVRAKNAASVNVKPDGDASAEEVRGDCVLTYGIPYLLEIARYSFGLVWRHDEEGARNLAIQDYERALQQQANARSRDLPTEDNSALHTWYNTRIHTARRLPFREDPSTPRATVGGGAFGTVFSALDLESGNRFAIKVIKLTASNAIEEARSLFHREVKTMERLDHKHIIELLGHGKWDSAEPEIYMPLRPGSLRNLFDSLGNRCDVKKLCMVVLEQMLCALDYLAVEKICHRDIKPENILYWDNTGNGDYVFQLADFGLARHEMTATGIAGTFYYEAPELHVGTGRPDQSPKMDVWSLFATLIDIIPDITFPPRLYSYNYPTVLQAVRNAAKDMPLIAAMVREDPSERASAAQMLVALFGGRGLKTPHNKVPPIMEVVPPAAPTAPHAAPPASPAPAPAPVTAGPENQKLLPAEERGLPEFERPIARKKQLVQYPRRPNTRQSPAGGGNILPPTAWPNNRVQKRAQNPAQNRLKKPLDFDGLLFAKQKPMPERRGVANAPQPGMMVVDDPTEAVPQGGRQFAKAEFVQEEGQACGHGGNHKRKDKGKGKAVDEGKFLERAEQLPPQLEMPGRFPS